MDASGVLSTPVAYFVAIEIFRIEDFCPEMTEANPLKWQMRYRVLMMSDPDSMREYAMEVLSKL